MPIGAKAPRLLSTLIVTITICLVAPVAHGHGMVGDRIFLSPIIGNDAFPDNALSLSSRGSAYASSLLPSLEKQLSDDSSILITSGWDEVEPKGKPRESGARDLSIFFRRSIFVSVPHEMEFTLSPLLVVPTGDRRIGDEGFTHLGGELLLAKGMGDLPRRSVMTFLRPFALQAEAGYAGGIQGPAHSDLFANLDLDYSFRYLGGDSNFDRGGMNFVPFTQFNYSQSLQTSNLSRIPDFRITPGIAYMGHYFEVSLGAQIALSRAAQARDRVAGLGMIEFWYDDVFPTLGWQPF